MTTLRTTLAGCRRAPHAPDGGTTDLKRRLGAIALGTLIGGGPGLAVAEERAEKRCGPVCQQQRASAVPGREARSASPATHAPPNETPPLALLAAPALDDPAVTFTVTTAADIVDPVDGKLSLREAVAKANATAALDAIKFKTSLEGHTLVLTGGELVISEDLTIDGDRDDNGSRVTIDGNRNGQILSISGGDTDVALEDLVLTHGGGAVLAYGAIAAGGASLTVTRCTISDNTYGPYGYAGGGIVASGELTIIDSSIIDNRGYGTGGINASGIVTIRGSRISGNSAQDSAGGLRISGSLVIEDSIVSDNNAVFQGGAAVGGLFMSDGTATIARSTFSGNSSDDPGPNGLKFVRTQVSIVDATIANNPPGGYSGNGGVYIYSGALVLRSSTITGNDNTSGFYYGAGGIRLERSAHLDIADSIVAGNGGSYGYPPDISGPITFSNGHNVFGSTVAGSAPGDRQNVAPSSVFAAIDPATGGGKLSGRGTAPLKNRPGNPALSGGDPLIAGRFGQLGIVPRPRPAGSLPDIGPVEIEQPLSTRPTIHNDVLTGSAAANNLAGLAGDDVIKGLARNDTLGGGDGSDVLDGGPGNDILTGGIGVDLVTYAGTTAVEVDLSGTTDTAKRGGETDTLIAIEGAIGSTKADTFKGDPLANSFQGGRGKDRYVGGAGRDRYDFDAVADSPAGPQRDVIGDFAHLGDVIDLAGIDADAAPEIEIQLTGKKTLSEADFVP